MTAILVCEEGRVVGLLGFADELRPSAGSALETLNRMGIKLILLSGDNRQTVAAVARHLKLDELHAELLPADKTEKISVASTNFFGQMCADVMVITPICPHSLSIRSVVLNSKSKISIYVETDMQKYSLSFDGQPQIICESGTSIDVTKAETTAKLIRLADYNFAKTLRTKLLWSEDLRDRQKFDVK